MGKRVCFGKYTRAMTYEKSFSSGRGSAVEEQNWLDDAAWMLDARTALRTTDWFDELSSTPRQTKIPADGSSSSCCQPQAVEEDAEEGAVEEGEAHVAEKQLAGTEANLPRLAVTAEWLPDPAA